MIGAQLIRPAREQDRGAWSALWADYCTALDGVVTASATDGLWSAILDDGKPVGCLLAEGDAGTLEGFANYVLHPHTWSLRSVCYLEDLYVAPSARGSGAARALIAGLEELGRRHDWRRVYWHAHETNYRARALYDRITPRTSYVRYDIEL